MAFPVLSSTARSVTQQAIDDTIKTPMEAGYAMTRPRFTRVFRKFECSYILSKADADTLVAFDETNRGSTIFAWTHPDTNTVYNVRFRSDARLRVTPMLDTLKGSGRLYQAEFGLEEA